jgi:predicted amidohydrolase
MRQLMVIGCSFLFLLEPPVEAEKLKVASVQYEIKGGQAVDQIIRRSEKLVQVAVKNGAKVIVFPELNLFDMWPTQGKVDARKLSKRIIREAVPKWRKRVQALAKRYEVLIVGGSYPQPHRGGIGNAALIALPDGTLKEHFKIHLTDFEVKQKWTRGKAPTLVQTPWGRVVVLICYDSEFPSTTQQLVDLKPDLILIPSMTESVEGLRRVRWSALARSVEHHAYVVVTGAVGNPTPDWKMWAQALFVTPQGGLLGGEPALGPYNRAGIAYHTFDMALLGRSREKTKFFPAREQRGEK